MVKVFASFEDEKYYTWLEKNYPNISHAQSLDPTRPETYVWPEYLAWYATELEKKGWKIIQCYPAIFATKLGGQA